MLITTKYYDVPTKLDPNGSPVRIFVISPSVQNYPQAKFPGQLHTFFILTPDEKH